MGTTYLITYRNWTIPARAVDAMLAGSRDDLTSGRSPGLPYDAANHRWIVEWSRRNMAGGGRVFEPSSTTPRTTAPTRATGSSSASTTRW
jgi:hypothetical protein